MKSSIPPRVRERYNNACLYCKRKHREIYDEDFECEYLKKKKYCPDIMETERKRASGEVLSDHMEEYLSLLTSNDTRGYKYIKDNVERFSKKELLAIISALDYSIYPKLRGILSAEQVDKIYKNLNGFVRNEFIRGHSEQEPN